MEIAKSVGLVTGGASGLGAGTARMLVERGGRVGILDLPSSNGVEFAAELGDNAFFVEADVADEASVAAAVDAVAEKFGRIDVCVNAAGISPASRVLSRKGDMHPLDVFRKTVEVNLIGTFDVLRHAVRVMSQNEPGPDGERGLIVNVSSAAALEGQVGQAAYAASKGGIVALTLPLARDLAIWGIRVMTVCPGIMDTGMLAGTDEKRREALMDIHVFPKRLGRPDDFSSLVATFMETTLLNGEVVRLDAATRL
ncbi:SDR family NAD(P)-dependent oxidoreductase [Mycolicibacterium confluentis]|uniref:3-hydroxyacyl-CoA dehydrogenase n=1 Tax=Mycolicibacterium confluentis TaxID=28047 RepID=A0A7I7XZ30_9MYCO|nr:SDR family NAD(P)-dependent oxidoreductase [Mycolicibacterium confluentis]MCV7319528.1 SDR family NAD(P)-dependent oxidoreductase [Mycolicibacterium confluentis]ORV34154.1 3-hydroxy-2-methylbutyryl-CoA dehydrogenase [Mycolicibacterium confluentis]BBZ34549.1 3-hydroxyacyl-CoA dehydrogenase [Mycolicibacterium confluentis]